MKVVSSSKLVSATAIKLSIGLELIINVLDGYELDCTISGRDNGLCGKSYEFILNDDYENPIKVSFQSETEEESAMLRGMQYAERDSNQFIFLHVPFESLRQRKVIGSSSEQ